MSMEGEIDKIRFTAMEAVDYSADDFDFNHKAATLHEFEVPLARATGARDWQHYVDSKERDQYNVYKTAEDAESGDEEARNMHDHLAGKLKNWLDREGLKHLPHSDVQYPEEKLIGSYIEYRSLAQNPDRLMHKLGLRPGW